MAHKHLRELWRGSCERSRVEVEKVLSDDGMNHIAARTAHGDSRPNLRWILTHMIEECSRHNGHVDLMRELIDGLTGD